MSSLLNKNNTLYIIAGSFAALTLLTLIVAPYASFISPLLALSISTAAIPLAILSVLVIVFSYKVMNDRVKVEKLTEENKNLFRHIQQLTQEKEQLQADNLALHQAGLVCDYLLSNYDLRRVGTREPLSMIYAGSEYGEASSNDVSTDEDEEVEVNNSPQRVEAELTLEPFFNHRTTAQIVR